MRPELSLVFAQLLGFPVALTVSLLEDGPAQAGVILAFSAFPVFMIAGAILQVPTFFLLRRYTRANYPHFAVAGLMLGVLPAAVLLAAGLGIVAAAAAATWFISSTLLFRLFARRSFEVALAPQA